MTAAALLGVPSSSTRCDLVTADDFTAQLASNYGPRASDGRRVGPTDSAGKSSECLPVRVLTEEGPGEGRGGDREGTERPYHSLFPVELRNLHSDLIGRNDRPVGQDLGEIKHNRGRVREGWEGGRNVPQIAVERHVRSDRQGDRS